MKSGFVEYLKGIGMTNILIERVEKIYRFYEGIFPEKITDIFVTDYIKEDGSREYENLWFFSSHLCAEAKLFVTQDCFDMDALNKITYWEIDKKDYDFKKATESSRLKITFKVSSTGGGLMRASKENCDYLRGIFQKHIMPYFKRGVGFETQR